jgi:hypothetical protein
MLMKGAPNIMPNAFKKGAFTGYGRGNSIYLIARTGSRRYSETWRAERKVGDGPYVLFASNLVSMGEKLNAIGETRETET